MICKIFAFTITFKKNNPKIVKFKYYDLLRHKGEHAKWQHGTTVKFC